MKGFKRVSTFVALVLVIVLSLTACGQDEQTQAPANEGEKPGTSFAGTYDGSAEGYHGNLNVSVELDETGKILSVAVGEDHGETPGIGDIAIEKLPKLIVEAQSLGVDAVAGATRTSDGIIGAVANALSSAGLDPAALGYVPKEVDKWKVAEYDASTMPEKAPTTDTIVIKDVKGREVSIDVPISTYALSTMDVIDFIIPILGEDAFHKLVASGNDGGNGILGYDKLYTPVVGTYMTHFGQISEHNAPFDLEMILAQDPDVLIVNSAMQAHKYALEIEPQLIEAGIPIVLIDVPGKNLTASTQDTFKILGRLFQKDERAAEVSTFIDEQYSLIDTMNLDEKTDKATVYYEKGGASEVFGSTATSLSGWGVLIDYAGGANIADPILIDAASGKGSSNTLDPEIVLEANPEFVIMSGGGWMDNHANATHSEPSYDIVNRTGWSELKAIKDGNLYNLSQAMNRSTYSFFAVIKIASWLYPEEFENIDVDAIIDEYFDRFMLTDSSVNVWSHKWDGVTRK
ncbi:MAG TPA: FMN-binding protein [Clostridiales bacterium]|nr:FMN-binding protein [Clostridiales bacterium]